MTKYFITYIDETGNKVITEKCVFPGTILKHLQDKKVSNVRVYRSATQQDMTDMFLRTVTTMNNCYGYRLQSENKQLQYRIAKLEAIMKALTICLNAGFSVDCNYCERNNNCYDVEGCPVVDELMQKVRELDGDNNEENLP